MTTRTLRPIVKIDENLCDSCGLCIPSCAKGALRIIDGSAKLVSEIYCDGLGTCLSECPLDAITVEEREAAEFDEKATEDFLKTKQPTAEAATVGCPSATVAEFRQESDGTVTHAAPRQPSALTQWPVQLTLVPPSAPFLQGTDLVLAADCVPFAYTGFHQDFLKDHSLLIACPKLDDYQAHLEKLTDIFTLTKLKSLTVVHMEVPCCFGLLNMVDQAKQASGSNIPVKEGIIGIQGDIKS